jgi:hypothetical protein
MRHADVPSLEALWAAAPDRPIRTFDPGRTKSLPAAARRLLTHAIEPGAPLHQAIRLQMQGEIKLGRWRPFEAEQVIRWGRGMVWRAKAKLGPVSIAGQDAVVDGVGQMRWRLAGIIPVMHADGPDVSRSAAGRLELEATLLPSVLLDDDVRWHPSDDEHVAQAHVHVPGDEGLITLHVDAAGRLQRASTPRWGNPEGGEFHEVPFGVILDGELHTGGYAIPATIRAGWYFGTERFESEGEFFRAEILSAQLR